MWLSGLKKCYLKKHIQSKHEVQSQGSKLKHIVKFSCKHCEKQFLRQSTLTSHVHLIHEVMKYACKQCDYQTNKKGCLRRHSQSKHGGAKTYIQPKTKVFPKIEVKAASILQNYYLHQSSIYSHESGIKMDNYDRVVIMDNAWLINTYLDSIVRVTVAVK